MGILSQDYLVLYRVRNGDFVFQNKELLKDFNIIKNPLFYWCADPFVVSIKGHEYVFAETAANITRKGHIRYKELGKRNSGWKKTFRPQFHVSFPNLFFENNELFVIPETSQHNCVSIYKIDFDFVWANTNTIFKDVWYVDTAFIKNEFGVVYVSYDISDYQNPKLVVTQFDKENTLASQFFIKDVKKMLRPAGNLFELNGQIVFPTQDCSSIYGGAILFNYFNVKTCTVSQFNSIVPSDITNYLHIKRVVGCHTYNFDENIEVIDVVYERFTVGGLIFKILRRLFPPKRKIR